jgi:hypothetical protein
VYAKPQLTAALHSTNNSTTALLELDCQCHTAGAGKRQKANA